MNIKVVHQLLEEKGRKMVVTDTSLQENSGPWESYYKLQFEEGKWKFIFVQWERKNGEEKVLKVFNDEEIASREYFLFILKSYYFYEYIRPFRQRNEDINVSGPEFNIKNLKEALRRLKIPKEYYSLDGELKEHSMVLEKVNDKKSKAVFIGENYKDIGETLVLENWEVYSCIYQWAYYTYLLDKECKSLIDKNIIDIKFTDAEYFHFFFPGI